MDVKTKLEILSDAAKYDVSCSSSGSRRPAKHGALGSTEAGGICHSFTPDGRCISLLKILLTNYCQYDCVYCINRKSNDARRAAFSVDEVVDLTINFYRRNYIEGLFLSSAIFKSPNHTMEMLTAIVKKLRQDYGFRGYIHLKAIPGADEQLIHEAGLYADRMSVNIELPSASSLKLLAPDKKKEEIFTPMKNISNHILSHQEEWKKSRKAPLFVPGGQSTQLIIGATPDSDLNILTLTQKLYDKYQLKRVYYSAYVPVNKGKDLPVIENPPTLREHRLYQSDWLLRFYGFRANELLDEAHPQLDIHFDPKTSWALNHLEVFPIEINKAPYAMLLRVPGIGVRGAQKIVSSRRVAPLGYSDLKKLGIVLKRAQYFITCNTKYYGSVDLDGEKIRQVLMPTTLSTGLSQSYEQLNLFTPSFQNSITLSPSPKPLLLIEDGLTALTGEI